jgi:hypothetical protein
MGLLHVQVVLRFRLLSDAPAVSTIELPTETPWASFPPIHSGGRGTNVVLTVSQDSRPHLVQLQWLAQEPRGCVVFQNSLN